MLLSIEFPNLEKIGDDFLINNRVLKQIVFPNLKIYGKNFLRLLKIVENNNINSDDKDFSSDCNIQNNEKILVKPE